MCYLLSLELSVPVNSVRFPPVKVGRGNSQRQSCRHQHEDEDAWSTGDSAARMRGPASSPGPPLGTVLGKRPWAGHRTMSYRGAWQQDGLHPPPHSVQSGSGGGWGMGEGAQELQDPVETSQPLQEGGRSCGRKGNTRRKPGTSPRTRAIHYLSTHVP